MKQSSCECKILTEVKSATPVNTRMIRKFKQLIADREKLIVVWREDQTSHNIPLGQSTIENEAAEAKVKNQLQLAYGFKGRSHLHNGKVLIYHFKSLRGLKIYTMYSLPMLQEQHHLDDGRSAHKMV